MDVRLQLRLLGTPEVTLDGVSVIGALSGKAQAVLYYLAVKRQPQSRSTLAGLLWGDLSERSARSNLRKVLVNLRQTVGAHLQIDRHYVAFKAECNCWVDVTAIETSVGVASAAIDIRQLQQAVESYQGDFLDGFYVLHAPDFEAWMFSEQARLRELAVQALLTLAGSSTDPYELPRGIAYARRLLDLEPWREEAHRLLMILLALDGQRCTAIDQYKHCCQILNEELGVEPMAETTALYERILTGETFKPGQFQVSSPTADDPDFTIRASSLSPSIPANNLPAQLTPLIGREPELARLAKLLSDPEIRLVTILGPGGMGKTRLALEFAQQQLSNFVNGVYFVPLAPLTSPDSIVPTIAEAINFSFYEGGTPSQQLFDYLRQKQMLIVLDNFEHLRTGASLVVEMLGLAPGLKILITSRAILNVQAEHLCPISGIDVPQNAEALELAARSSGIRLFLQSARRVQPDFDLNPDNLEDVIQICCLVEGMPLGILLAAAWIDLLHPAEIVAEMRHSANFLETKMRDLPERQRSLQVVFDNSWRLLTEREQTFFKQLSIFRGGFDYQAVQAISDVSLRELRALTHKSMLSRTPSGRYNLHDLLQQFGLGKLVEDPTQEANARKRHSAYYCAVLPQLEVDLKGPRQQTALAELEQDAENLLAAWNWAVKQGEAGRLAQGLDGLCLFYEWRGRYIEGETACRLAAEMLSDASSADQQLTLARLLTWQSVFNLYLGRTDQAKQLIRLAQATLGGPGMKRQYSRQARAFTCMQNGRIMNNDRNEAAYWFRKSLDLYQAIHDNWGTANALDQLAGILYLSMGHDQAKQLLEQSLVIRRSLGDSRGIFSVLCLLALITIVQGYIDEAKHRQEEIRALLPTLNDPISLANGSFTIGRILFITGQFDESSTWLKQSLAIYKELGLRSGVSLTNRGWLCHVLIEKGKYDRAYLEAQKALSLGREIGDRDTEAMALRLLGLVEMARHAYPEAQNWLQQSSEIYREMVGIYVPRAWWMLGRAAYGMGDIPQTRKCLVECLRGALKSRILLAVRWGISLYAILSVSSGNVERAVELRTLNFQDPFMCNSQFEKDVFGQYIEAAMVELPAEAVAAAQERGKSRELWTTAAEILSELESGKS